MTFPSTIAFRATSVALAFILSIVAMSCADESGTGDADADTTAAASGGSDASGAPQGDARALFDSATANFQRLTSYHALAEMTIGGQDARIEGDLGQNAVRFKVQGADGSSKEYVQVGDRAMVSTDGGATWQEETDGITAQLSAMVTQPGQMAQQLGSQGELALAGTEEIDGTEATRLTVASKSPAELWVVRDAGAGLVLKRIKAEFDANDAAGKTVVTYSAFNEPVDITLPAAAQ